MNQKNGAQALHPAVGAGHIPVAELFLFAPRGGSGGPGPGGAEVWMATGKGRRSQLHHAAAEIGQAPLAMLLLLRASA